MRLNKTIGIIGAIALLAMILYFGSGLFAVTAGTPPTCVFTDTDNTCQYNYTLGEERAASLLTFDLEFGATPGTELLGGDVVLPLLGTTDLYEESTRYDRVGTLYLYEVPAGWEDAYDVVLTATGSQRVICNRPSEKVNVYTNLRSVAKPYSLDTIKVCSDNQCDIDKTPYLIIKDHASDGDAYYTLIEAPELGSATSRCYLSDSEYERGEIEDIRNNYVITGVVPSTSLYGTDLTKFELEIYHHEEGGDGSYTTPKLKASYHKAYYPRDVAYSVGQLPITTFSGVQRNLTTTLDVASTVNLYCNRGVSAQECVVPLTFTSTQPGKLWVSVGDETLSFATENAALAELTGNIALLEGTLDEKIAYIDTLNASIEEKARIIAELTSIQSEQVALIESLDLNIQEQAEIINALTDNLETKAALVSQLQAETEDQAALIQQMELSFANQGAIISQLNNTVAQDKELINDLTTQLDEQAEILGGMDQSVDRESELVVELRTTIDEQQELLALAQSEKAGKSSVLFFGIGVLVVFIVLGALWFTRRS